MCRHSPGLAHGGLTVRVLLAGWFSFLNGGRFPIRSVGQRPWPPAGACRQTCGCFPPASH